MNLCYYCKTPLVSDESVFCSDSCKNSYAVEHPIKTKVRYNTPEKILIRCRELAEIARSKKYNVEIIPSPSDIAIKVFTDGLL